MSYQTRGRAPPASSDIPAPPSARAVDSVTGGPSYTREEWAEARTETTSRKSLSRLGLLPAFGPSPPDAITRLQDRNQTEDYAKKAPVFSGDRHSVAEAPQSHCGDATIRLGSWYGIERNSSRGRARSTIIIGSTRRTTEREVPAPRLPGLVGSPATCEFGGQRTTIGRQS